MKSLHVTALLAGCASLAAVGTAAAGGFNRGTADTDLLFEEGNFNMRAGVTIVMPQRGYETITAPRFLPRRSSVTDGKCTETYAIPSAAIKFNVMDDLRCVGTYTQPFGADSEYGAQAILSARRRHRHDARGVHIERVRRDLRLQVRSGQGHVLWLIGGGFVQDFDYSPDRPVYVCFRPASLRPATGTLSLQGRLPAGLRLGVAYEIPEIALRAQLMYRSAVDHSPSGGTG